MCTCWPCCALVGVSTSSKGLKPCLLLVFCCCEGLFVDFLKSSSPLVFCAWIYFEIFIVILGFDVVPTLGDENTALQFRLGFSAALSPLAHDCTTCTMCMVIHTEINPTLRVMLKLPAWFLPSAGHVHWSLIIYMLTLTCAFQRATFKVNARWIISSRSFQKTLSPP